MVRKGHLIAGLVLHIELVNLFSILRFEADRNVAKLRKPVDKDKWATEPAVVNAFYNPNKNDIGTTIYDLIFSKFY